MLFFFVNFAVLAILSKSISHSFQYYKAALVYIFVMLVFTAMFGSKVTLLGLAIVGIIKLLVALPIFYLLDRYSDTIFTWLLIFGIANIVLLLV